MNLADIFKASDAITVKRVFGEPYEKDGLTIIPAALVAGGGGGGGGHDAQNQEGEGGGFGLSARPAGAYVVRNGQVSWQPAVDPNRIFTALAVVLVAFLLTRPRVVRARAKAIAAKRHE
jgi:uncharacterized spore protein YtfJ